MFFETSNSQIVLTIQSEQLFFWQQTKHVYYHAAV